MTLLTAVQQACQELALQSPQSVIGNTDPQVVQLLALANREAQEYAAIGGQWSGWPELRKEYTFSLVPATTLTNNGVYVGNTTNGSRVLSGFTDTTGILAGYGVSGGSILTGAIVDSVTPTTVTLNTPANATSTGLNFSFGQIAYDFPSDLQDFISASMWDRNFRWQLLGPISAQEWQTIVSGICPVGPRIRYRIMDGQFYIQPPPGAAQTDVIAYEYISVNWCRSSGGTGQSSWQEDTDVYLWPENTLTLGIKWRFLRAKGLDYGEERKTYDWAVDRQIARSGSNRALPMNIRNSDRIQLISNAQVPDTGFGT